jgi:probable O-glycosylation ligase (exosortase A-associated)
LDIYHSGFGGLDNNGAGLMIAMGVPMAYFLWQVYRRWWRWIFLAVMVLMIHAVLMTYSRGAMVSLLICVPLLIMRSARKLQMMIAVACFSLLVPMLAGEEIRARFFSVEEYEDDHGAQARLASWQAAWRIAQSNPIFGVGIRNAELLTPHYFAGWGARAIHSQYFQIAADAGFPAIVFYLSVLFGTWRVLRRTARQCRGASSDDDWLAYNLACGLEGALVVFVSGAAFLSLDVFELPYLLILLGLQLSLIVQEDSTAVAASRTVSALGYRPQKVPS